MTLAVGFVMGIVYMLVDYGIFNLLLGTRSISEGHSPFWVLLWMSMSYGFTNFTWIWLWISKDENLFELSLLILCWWFCCPFITDTFSHGTPIIIERTTGSYHGNMAAIMFAGYLIAIIWNLTRSKKLHKINIPWILAIGILVQFGWEAGLLLGGIRSAGFESFGDKLRTLVVNSLMETNLGIPYVYLIFIALTSRFTEQIKRRRKVSFVERIAENNLEKIGR